LPKVVVLLCHIFSALRRRWRISSLLYHTFTQRACPSWLGLGLGFRVWGLGLGLGLGLGIGIGLGFGLGLGFRV
jgi:hypothetical protein